MKKLLTAIVTLTFCISSVLPAFANQGGLKEISMSDISVSDNLTKQFIKNSDSYEVEDGNYIFKKTEKISSTNKNSLKSTKEGMYKTTTMVIFADTDDEKADLEKAINNITNSVSTSSSSGGSNYVYKWDSSDYIKGYCTAYYDLENNDEYATITSASGGYTGGGSGVSVKTQSVLVGQSGKTYSNGTKAYTMSKTPTGKTWNYSTPSTWKAVEASAVSAGGVTYILRIKRGTSTSTWKLEINNLVFGTGGAVV